MVRLDSRGVWVRRLSVATLVAVVACAGDGPATSLPPVPRAGVGDPCFADADCPSEMCLSIGYCSAPCADDRDCGTSHGYVCGVGTGGVHQCVPQCPSTLYHYVCVGGVSTACAVAGSPSDCETCGCGPSRRCDPGVGCVSLGGYPGEACLTDSECRSSNCSRLAGVCRVAIGDSCSAHDCDLCVVRTSGSSYCSSECRTDADCDGDVCFGSFGPEYFTCRPRCSGASDPSCPGSCQLVGDMRFVCTCTGCTTLALRGVGQECNDDAMCAASACLGRVLCVGAECQGFGYCTTSCTTDAACGAEGRCVDVPCVEGPTIECGHVCLPACGADGTCDPTYSPYHCAALPDVDGSTVMVCDARLADGDGPCRTGRDCESGNCVSATCAP